MGRLEGKVAVVQFLREAGADKDKAKPKQNYLAMKEPM